MFSRGQGSCEFGGGRGTMSREVSEPVAFDYISVAEEELLTIISRAQTQPGPIKH